MRRTQARGALLLCVRATWADNLGSKGRCTLFDPLQSRRARCRKPRTHTQQASALDASQYSSHIPHARALANTSTPHARTYAHTHLAHTTMHTMRGAALGATQRTAMRASSAALRAPCVVRKCSSSSRRASLAIRAHGHGGGSELKKQGG